MAAAKKHATTTATRKARRVPLRVLGKMTNTPWAIREGMLDTMVGIANRDGLRAVSDEMVREEPEICQMVVRDGVAVIPVIGPSFRYASWIHDACGATSYDAIARDLNLALEDPAVKAILFEFDSPGGEVTGCNATAAKIRAARGRKPIVAWVEGDACSAAYWLASACDHVVIDECAQLGSIGVVGIFNDTRGMDEKLGIKRYEIVSSQSPGKRPDPATDEGRAAIQVVIDDLASVFVDAVAINRGVSPEDVVARFGGGGCFVGQKAIDAGLADEIGTFDEVLAELAGVEDEAAGEAGLSVARPAPNLAPQPGSGATRASNKGAAMAVNKLRSKLAAKSKAEDETEDKTKSKKAKSKAKDEREEQAEDEEDEELDVPDGDDEDEDSEIDDENAEGEDEDEEAEDGDEDEEADEGDDEEEVEPKSKKAKAKSKAMTERQRISAIVNAPEARGRSALAKHFAFQTGMSPKSARAALAKAPQASGGKPKGKRGQAFYDAMGNAPNPKANSGRGGRELSGEDAEIAAIVAAAADDGLTVKKA